MATEAEVPAIELRGATVRLGGAAIGPLDLSIARGERIAIVGERG